MNEHSNKIVARCFKNIVSLVWSMRSKRLLLHTYMAEDLEDTLPEVMGSDIWHVGPTNFESDPDFFRPIFEIRVICPSSFIVLNVNQAR
jgi:hypothetical protein